MRGNIFNTRMEWNRLCLPLEIPTYISSTLKHEKEDREIKEVIDLYPVHIKRIRGLYLIPHLYRMRYLHRIIDKFPVGFLSAWGYDNMVSVNMRSDTVEGVNRIYLRDNILQCSDLMHARSTKVRAGSKVIIVSSICGWLIWDGINWEKVKGKLVFLHHFVKYKGRYIKVAEKAGFLGIGGGLKRMLEEMYLNISISGLEDDSFLIIESSPNTYIFRYSERLYKNICDFCKKKQHIGDETIFSQIDYRCSVPREFRVESADAHKIIISFKKIDMFFDFIIDSVPKCQRRGRFKALFKKENGVYTLAKLTS